MKPGEDAGHADDLALAARCAAGEAAAMAEVERRFFPALERALPRAPDRRLFKDEVFAVLRERLFVAAPGGRPKIAEYAGKSELGSWLRVVTVRLALNLLRGDKKNARGDDDIAAALPAPGDDPELAHLKRRYRAEFRAALKEGAAALTVRDRNLLRQHHVDGLTMDQLAALYRAHRVTVVRWVGKARETLGAETRAALTRRLRVDKRELASILRLVESRLDDVGIRTLLKEGD